MTLERNVMIILKGTKEGRMKTNNFKRHIGKKRSVFSQRVRMSENEFRQHIKTVLGIFLGYSSDKTFAMKINHWRCFYFKIGID